MVGDAARGRALAVAACTASTQDNQEPAAKSAHEPVTLNVWTFYTGRELDIFKTALGGLQDRAPWITVKVTGGKAAARHPARHQQRHRAGRGHGGRAGRHREVRCQWRLDRPQPLHHARQARHEQDHPPVGARLHRLRRQAGSTAAADRCLRPLLQQGHVPAGRDQRTAEDLLGAVRRREEAHPAQPGRVDQGGRFRAAEQLLRDTAAGPRSLVGRAVVRVRRILRVGHRSCLERPRLLPEADGRLLRLRHPDQVLQRARWCQLGVDGIAGVRAGQGRDGARRRVAGGNRSRPTSPMSPTRPRHSRSPTASATCTAWVRSAGRSSASRAGRPIRPTRGRS